MQMNAGWIRDKVFKTVTSASDLGNCESAVSLQTNCPKDRVTVSGMLRRFYYVLFVIVVAISIPTMADKPPKSEPTTKPVPTFVRYEEDGHGGGSMQAAVGRYVNDDGVELELLSTMHIGEPAFFRDLARQFPKYDAVLYELVAPRGVAPTEEGVNDQQKMIARDCGLQNQGPHMDYNRANFVHADLSLEEIQQLVVKKTGTFKGALGDGPGLKAARDERDTAGVKAIFADLEAAKTAGPAEQTRLLRRAYSRQLAITAMPVPGTTYPAVKAWKRSLVPATKRSSACCASRWTAGKRTSRSFTAPLTWSIWNTASLR